MQMSYLQSARVNLVMLSRKISEPEQLAFMDYVNLLDKRHVRDQLAGRSMRWIPLSHIDIRVLINHALSYTAGTGRPLGQRYSVIGTPGVRLRIWTPPHGAASDDLSWRDLPTCRDQVLVQCVLRMELGAISRQLRVAMHGISNGFRPGV